VSLVTRCPVCGTAFRVQRSQLAGHGGSVRCGKCAAVFDGVAGLVEEGVEQLALEPSPQLGLFDPSRRPQAAANAAASDDAPLPTFMEEEDSGQRRTWLWASLALLAALALGVQAVYRFRAELAAHLPESRAPLADACRLLGCEVPLPRRPDLMSIDSSELQTDSRREDVIVLNAVIRNRARFPQDYPSLELTLTDESERPVLRRVLAPRDYLDTGRAGALMAQGIAGGSEISLRIFLDSRHSRATGYRLYLFFPQ
jgi:predicted Zn finger-like uncharacterized protein